jgi:hypothetical protein
MQYSRISLLDTAFVPRPSVLVISVKDRSLAMSHAVTPVSNILFPISVNISTMAVLFVGLVTSFVELAIIPFELSSSLHHSIFKLPLVLSLR